MQQHMERRIQKMFLGDVAWACGFVAMLWAAIGYVFLNVTSLAGDATVTTVLALGAGLVLIFNTAAIVAMVKHYAHEKRFIYGLDIRHLDESREARARRRSRPSSPPSGAPVQAKPLS